MKRILFYPVTIVIFLILHVVIIKGKSFGIMPDIFLLGTIYFSLKRGAVTGMAFGFFSGLVKDAFLLGPFGTNALVKTIIGFLVGTFQKKIYEDSLITQAGIVLVFSFLYYWAVLFIQLMFGQPYYIRPFVKSVLFAVYNGAAAPLVFYVLRLWEKNNVAK